jgi:hypothetical protein
MKSWEEFVPNLFIADGYCKNWSDVGRAFDWMVDLRRNGIGWAEAERLLRQYMATQTWGAPYVEDQVNKARDRMKPWLLD